MIAGGMKGSRRRRAAAAGALLALAATAAGATSVSFSGLLGTKALLVIDGQAQPMAVGSTVQGVRLVRLDGTTAQVETDGRPLLLRLGGAAVVGRRASGGTHIVLEAGRGGHYLSDGSINGHPVRFMVDTGATAVAMSADVAAQLGLDYNGSRAALSSTANGIVRVRTLSLATLTVGDVTVHDVEAVVVPQAMPTVLLGNSFLSRFDMRSDGMTLTLDRKN